MQNQTTVIRREKLLYYIKDNIPVVKTPSSASLVKISLKRSTTRSAGT